MRVIGLVEFLKMRFLQLAFASLAYTCRGIAQRCDLEGLVVKLGSRSML
jgi:hypothetical protein